jgi:uncharacterized phage infection (PIP) family protein YhgE
MEYRFCLSACAAWICLALFGCMLPEANDDARRQRIQELETQNKQLQEKNMELLAQNQRLKDLAERVLQRLDGIQKEQQRLIEENKNLYQKLYDERLAEHDVATKEREKRIQELESEAEKLMRDLSGTKQEIQDSLARKREELVRRGEWTREDEVGFMDVLEKLMSQGLAPRREEEAVRNALLLDEQLARRIAEKRTGPKK